MSGYDTYRTILFPLQLGGLVEMWLGGVRQPGAGELADGWMWQPDNTNIGWTHWLPRQSPNFMEPDNGTTPGGSAQARTKRQLAWGKIVLKISSRANSQYETCFIAG